MAKSNNSSNPLGISFKTNPEQMELVRLINENDLPIIFCEGKAGTGKTFATLAAALQMKLDKKYDRIIYARNPVQLGEDMGALPGGIDEKYDPFMGPLNDNLESIAKHRSGASQVYGGGKKYGKRGNEDSYGSGGIKDLKARIEITPIAFLRGRSFENTILIVDEAQNLDLTVLKTILTRVGMYSKVILLGSMNQIDDRRQKRKAVCDYQKVIDALKDKTYVGYVELIQSMGSPICVEIDEVLSKIVED